MNEEAVRQLVRELIARHLPAAEAGPGCASAQPARAPRSMPLAWHSSHARYAVLSGEETDGPCFIEPAVRCNHCGYCQSHGH